MAKKTSKNHTSNNSLQQSIDRLEKELSEAVKDGNARKINTLKKVLKCFQLKLLEK